MIPCVAGVVCLALAGAAFWVGSGQRVANANTLAANALAAARGGGLRNLDGAGQRVAANAMCSTGVVGAEADPAQLIHPIRYRLKMR